MIIRKANPNDASDIAKAIVSAGGHFLPWLFGRNYRKIIYESALSENCSFSWINADVCEISDAENPDSSKIAGVVISYASEREHEMDKGMSDVLRKYFGFFSLFSFIRKAQKAVKYFPKPKDSYYILAIAVFEEYKGRGIAGKLMGWIESRARSSGYKSLMLEVEGYNHSAIRSYQKFGFHKHGEVPLKLFSRKLARESKHKNPSMWLLKKEM
ncbi:GNAT family N-acetyltransferase [Candidatus Woesearchaeota archaeon]|nr:GNAT family N-acetyltransferase [Candidatus Woesearchaeota archaeon]